MVLPLAETGAARPIRKPRVAANDSPTRYNFQMKLPVFFAFILSAVLAPAQSASPQSATVPITLDHNRIVIDVYLPLPDGSTKRVRGWVDNGNPDLEMSRRAATLMGLAVNCDGQVCSATPNPRVVSLEVVIGGMKVFVSAMKSIRVPVGDSAIAPGMSPEINLPATVLRNYDVLVNFPDREFSIGVPGSLKFRGMSGKVQINKENGLVEIPSKIDGKNYNLGLDVGSSFSFLTPELFDKLEGTHADWPHVTGAVGNANMWGSADEPTWKLLRADRVQYGPVFLTGVAAARLPAEDDGRFTVLGIADFEGKPSVPEVQVGDHLFAVDGIPVPESTMGQVWSMLEGQPRQERKLTIERAGKQITVVGKVQHFLGEQPEKDTTKGKPERHYR